jgi:hypothetical protein
MRKLLIAAGVALVLGTTGFAQGTTEWAKYVDPQFGFSADLPYGAFQPLEEDGSGGLTLGEVDGNGQISIYGGDANGLTLDGFAERLTSGNDVRSITYRAEGNSWFVLSGFYEPETGGDPLIFYTKVLLSADRQTFSAFEISYDADQKALYDSVVSRIEDSFTRPTSG